MSLTLSVGILVVAATSIMISAFQTSNNHADIAALAKLDAACTPKESRALRMLSWLAFGRPPGTSLISKSVQKMVAKSADTPTTIPAEECRLAMQLQMSFTCPRIGCELSCPGGQCVAAMFAPAQANLKSMLWRHSAVKAHQVDMLLDAEVKTLHVRF